MLILANEANDRNKHDGKYWTYDSMEAISMNCPYWTPRKVETVIRHCREKGLIETAKLSKNPYDHTTWYTVTDLVRSIYENGGIEARKIVTRTTKNVDCLKEQIKTKERPKRESAREKNAYGEFGNVNLTDDELDKLTARWTPNQVEQEIESLSAYQRSKGKRYADHYATLLNWLKRDFPPEAAGGTRLIEEDWVNE